MIKIKANVGAYTHTHTHTVVIGFHIKFGFRINDGFVGFMNSADNQLLKYLKNKRFLAQIFILFFETYIKYTNNNLNKQTIFQTSEELFFNDMC